MAKPSTERQAAYRAQGRQIAIVLRDQKAIKSLDALALLHGGVTAAVTFAIHAAASKMRPH